MIRLGIIGTRSAGKTSVAKALALPHVEITDDPPLKRLSEDAYLLVSDKDLIDTDYEQVKRIARAHRPVGVLLNKADTYNAPQLRQLLQILRRRLDTVVPRDWVVSCSADPVRIFWKQNGDGSLTETSKRLLPEMTAAQEVAELLTATAENSFRVRARAFASQFPLAFRTK